MKISDMSIVSRLRLFVFFLMCILIGLFFLNQRIVNRLNITIQDLSEIQLPATRFIDMADMQHDAIRATAVESLMWTRAKGDEELKKLGEDLADAGATFHENLENLSKLKLTKSELEAVQLIKDQANNYRESAQELLEIVGTQDLKKRDQAFARFDESFDILKTSMEAVGDQIRKGADLAMVHANEEKMAAERTTLIVSLCILFVVGVFGASLIRSVRHLLNDMVARLDSQAKEISELSLKVLSAASSLASSTEQQSAAISESAAAVEEITSMAKIAAENAVRLEKTTVSSEETARKGSESTRDVALAISGIVQSFRGVLTQVESSHVQMKEILTVIGTISSKTNVINDIALESKILSFNASVEAARAGEHGKGFSVVAEEIGKLAITTVEASSEISQLLNESVKSVENILLENKNRVADLVAESEVKLKDGVSLAEICAKELDEIVKMSHTLAMTAIEISKASREQSSGLEQISSTMHLFEESNHSNAETSKDCSIYSEDLKKRSQQLDRMVDFVARISA